MFNVFLFIYIGAICFLYPTLKAYSQNIDQDINKDPVRSLHIVAIMVEFQPDYEPWTTGDGTFSEGNLSYLHVDSVSIDPLPHDRTYFLSHLEFVKNYYKRVSSNTLDISYDVLPDIIRLDEEMSHYSPLGEYPSGDKLVLLIQDAWQKVKDNRLMNTYQMPNVDQVGFIIFHAGIGRDIKLTGTPYDVTPYDIPSATFIHDDFNEFFNDLNFEGFDVGNDDFKVTNTMIIPRSETRRGEQFGIITFLELSINGWLCHSVGRLLGLPFLYDSREGTSTIGRFGLMDPASIFSYYGLFPPEPSAWERWKLGWTDVIAINKDSIYYLPAVGLHQDNSVYKYQLSDDEYFLFENRHRDPELDGTKITIRTPSGEIVVKNIQQDSVDATSLWGGFVNPLPAGVVIDVDGMDWSLPGVYDDENDIIFNGGILIWHVDEAVIRNNDGNFFNDNPNRRGLDLEEADGAQDIGLETAIDLINTNSYIGGVFDYWWSDNEFLIEQNGNRFAIDSRPNNRTNVDVDPHVEFYDFSANLPIASFRVRHVPFKDITPIDIGIDIVQGGTLNLNQPYYISFPVDPAILSINDEHKLLYVSTQQGTYLYPIMASNNTPLLQSSNLWQQPLIINDKMIIADIPTDNTDDIMVQGWQINNDGTLTLDWNISTSKNNGRISSISGESVNIDRGFATISSMDGQVIKNYNNAYMIASHDQNTYAYLDGYTLNFSESLNAESYNINTTSSRAYIGSMNLNATSKDFFLLEDHKLIFFKESNNYQPFEVIDEESMLPWMALLDWNEDGNTDIIYIESNGQRIMGYNEQGVILSNFPIYVPTADSLDWRFHGTPLVADIDGDGKQNLLVQAQNDDAIVIFGYDEHGNALSSMFPLYVGRVTDKNQPPLHFLLDDTFLYAVDHYGKLKVWEFSKLDNAQWPTRYGISHENYNRVVGITPQNVSNTPNETLLVDSETYNWPNPCHENTHIRYMVNESSLVSIRIIDINGYELFYREVNVSPKVAQEINIQTIQWQSGVYYVMVEAQSMVHSDEKGVKLIKMVVVH